MIQDIPIYDITIKAGEDFSWDFRLYNEDKTPSDLTGNTIRAQLRHFAEDSHAINFSCSHNNQGGQVTLILSHRATTSIRFESGVYDVIREYPGGFKECVLCGNVKIIPAVTR